MATIRVGDTATSIQLTVQEGGAALDVSGASVKQIILRKPDTSTVTYTATFGTDGTDGVLIGTTSSGDLDQPGTWKAYAFLTIGAWSGHTSAVEITVNPQGV